MFEQSPKTLGALAVLVLIPVIVLAGIVALVVVLVLAVTGWFSRDVPQASDHQAAVIPLTSRDQGTGLRRAA